MKRRTNPESTPSTTGSSKGPCEYLQLKEGIEMPKENWINHYHWLDLYLGEFFVACGLSPEEAAGLQSAHGDKCGTYRREWEAAGVSFPHGVAIYLLTYTAGYSGEVRVSADGHWVSPSDWVVKNYLRFQSMLPPVDTADTRIWMFPLRPENKEKEV